MENWYCQMGLDWEYSLKHKKHNYPWTHLYGGLGYVHFF